MNLQNGNHEPRTKGHGQSFDVTVVIPTVLRPHLVRAVKSIFAQDIDGTVQVFLGIDRAMGSLNIIDELRALCPENMAISVLDIGYSTSHHNGGIYAVRAGGSLRTAMSYLADSELVAYLDDDNWWADDHLSSLSRAISGFDWAFSLRWYVHPATLQTIDVDRVESVGPDKGIYRERSGGFVDTSCLMINKIRCHWMLPAWAIANNKVGTGEDRTVLRNLVDRHSVAWTDRATAYYVVHERDVPGIEKLLAENP